MSKILRENLQRKEAKNEKKINQAFSSPSRLCGERVSEIIRDPRDVEVTGPFFAVFASWRCNSGTMMSKRKENLLTHGAGELALSN